METETELKHFNELLFSLFDPTDTFQLIHFLNVYNRRQLSKAINGISFS